MAYLSAAEIAHLGLRAVGRDVLISDRCSLYGVEAISIGDRVRIDDFAIVTAARPVVLGSFVHVAPFAFLSGQHGLEIGDFVNLSPRATLLSGTDDFSGHWLPGALIPPELRQVDSGAIRIGAYCMVGAHSVVLPGVELGEGAAVGAVSLVKESLAAWGIYAGVPARFVRPRSRDLLALRERLPR